MTQTSTFINGKNGNLQGDSTKFATQFYSMPWLFHFNFEKGTECNSLWCCLWQFGEKIHMLFLYVRVLKVKCFWEKGWFPCTYGAEILQFQPLCNEQNTFPYESCWVYFKNPSNFVYQYCHHCCDEELDESLENKWACLWWQEKIIHLTFVVFCIIANDIFHFYSVTMDMMHSKILVWMQSPTILLKKETLIGAWLYNHKLGTVTLVWNLCWCCWKTGW